jgi:hypothetical protein
MRLSEDKNATSSIKSTQYSEKKQIKFNEWLLKKDSEKKQIIFNEWLLIKDSVKGLQE